MAEPTKGSADKDPPGHGTRRRYERPSVEELGSVRELTGGTDLGVSEGNGMGMTISVIG